MPAVRPDLYPTNQNECVLKSTVQGRAGDIDDILGCPACVSGFFLENKTCYACQTRIDSCTVCSITRCTACSATGFVLVDDLCALVTLTEHCAEARDSQCSKCSFWHEPANDRTHCETHAAWWVLFMIVLFVLFLIVIATVVVVLFVFHFIGNRHEKELQKSGTCFYAEEQCHVCESWLR